MNIESKPACYFCRFWEPSNPSDQKERMDNLINGPGYAPPGKSGKCTGSLQDGVSIIGGKPEYKIIVSKKSGKIRRVKQTITTNGQSPCKVTCKTFNKEEEKTKSEFLFDPIEIEAENT